MTEQPTSWESCSVGETLVLTIGGVWGLVAGAGEIDVDVIRVTEMKSYGVLEPATAARRSVTAAQLSSRLLQPGDLLLEKSGGGPNTPVGRVGRVRSVDGPSVCSNFMQLMRPNPEVMLPKFLMWQLVYAHLSGATAALQTATTNIRNLKMKEYWALRMRVPPLLEQKRIVAAIEEAFSKLDAGEVGLRAVRQRLKRMRDSVLAATFRGLDFDTQCVELCDEIVDCPHSTAAFLPIGRPCIDTTCIVPGRVVLDRLRFVSDETWHDRVRRLVPKEGDVIFAREGTIGTAVALPRDLDPCLGQRVMLLRPGASLLPNFLEKVLMSHQVKQQYRPLVVGSTAPHLNVRDVKRLLIPVPSISEQARMLMEVERDLSFVEACEQAIDEGLLVRSAALRRSVLKAAFEGKLVPQDPADEPASTLLDRIRHEREATEPRAGARPRRKKAEAS